MIIQEILDDCCEKAGVPELSSKIDVIWNNRYTRSVGRAIWNKNKGRGEIRLSSKIFPTIKNVEDKIDTIRHECAHIIVDYLLPKVQDKEGRGGHGPTWQRYAVIVGAKPERYFQTDKAYGFAQYKRKVTRYKVICGCPNGVEITKNRLTKMRNGKRYLCCKCKQELELV